MLPSCLAQSAPSRTANGGLFPFGLRTGFRIGFRKGFVKRAFLVSRGITKLRVLAYQHCNRAGAWPDIHASNWFCLHKSPAAVVLPIRQPVPLWTGTNPKTLAFCAARPHIVAVR